MRKIFSASGLFLLLLLVAAPTNADVLNFNLDFLYEGQNSPIGTAPWLAAEFQSIAGNRVRLTLDSTSLTGNENVGSWYFNYDPIFQFLFASRVSGPLADISIGQNSQNAGSASGFDIGFTFKEKFVEDQSAVFEFFLLANPANLNLLASSFNFVNEGGDFFSASQVLGIGPNAAFAWIADSKSGPGPTPIPEPATMILLSFGLAGLTIFGRNKFFV